MSVAVLKADKQLGYWEYSVQTESDGEWSLEFSRTVEAGPELADHPGMYRMHVNIKHDGEEFFNSWTYGDDYPFLTQYELNGVIAAAAVATLAFWYTASAKYHDVREARDKLREVLDGIKDVVGVEMIALDPETNTPIPADDPRTEETFYIRSEDCHRMGPYGNATHRVYLELHHYGVATTTKEWRIETFGEDDIEPAHWGCDHDHE